MDSGSMKDTELRLRLPGSESPEKDDRVTHRAEVVGWPPIGSFRNNSMASQPQKNEETKTRSGCLYVKVSMDGAPYLRKVDLNNYTSYTQFSSALENMFSCFRISQYGSHGVERRDGSEFALTYQDKDGDWMLVGDVPWVMFVNSCMRLRIMKSSEAISQAPRAKEK